MSVVWHRLGKEHPLVQQLDRLSCQQDRNLHARQRARRSDETTSDTARERDAAPDELAEVRVALEESVRDVLAEPTTPSLPAALITARAQLANVLAQGPKQEVKRRENSVG